MRISALAIGALCFLGCGNEDPRMHFDPASFPDATFPPPPAPPSDVGPPPPDAAHDAGVDALLDAPADAPPDAQSDALPDATSDAMPDGPAWTCDIQSFPAPTVRCQQQTADCLYRASTEEDVDACVEADPRCVDCYNDSYAHCVIGTPAAPGRCAMAYGCWFGCASAECGLAPSESCVDAAASGVCRAEHDEILGCYDPEASENTDCNVEANDFCMPDPACGNGIVDSGETCDGDCPWSCPSSGEECVVLDYTGGPSTCDVECTPRMITGCVPCEPSCGDRECGSDGCGGTCGSCGSGETCSSGTCMSSCTPSCSGRECGSDGCGGSCGSCSWGESCSWSGLCVAACTPSCSGRECGSDGCGGSCGSCSWGESCSSGQCVGGSPGSCNPVTNTGCDFPNECYLLSSESTACALTGSGTQGDSCSSTNDCDGGYGCFAGECRKICNVATDAGCSWGEVCNGVAGWHTYGACTSS